MSAAHLAPAARALLFFGFMGAAVSGLTFGASLQAAGDESSTTVAQAKAERNRPKAIRFAVADRNDRAQSATKRAIASPAQQAMLHAPAGHILR